MSTDRSSNWAGPNFLIFRSHCDLAITNVERNDHTTNYERALGLTQNLVNGPSFVVRPARSLSDKLSLTVELMTWHITDDSMYIAM